MSKSALGPRGRQQEGMLSVSLVSPQAAHSLDIVAARRGILDVVSSECSGEDGMRTGVRYAAGGFGSPLPVSSSDAVHVARLETPHKSLLAISTSWSRIVFSCFVFSHLSQLLQLRRAYVANASPPYPEGFSARRHSHALGLCTES